MLYTSLKTYSVTRSRTLVGHLFNLGIGISNDRVLSITKNIYEILGESFLTYNCFFPNVLKKGFFTVLIKDNIDVNAKSNIIQQHYHGTSISIVQFVTEGEKSIDFPEINISKPSSSQSKKLFVRSIREENSTLKWYFILDKFHYARWLTIHLFDVLTLDVKFPEVYTQMQKGFFSFQKSNREFSRMALDHIHEQNNGVIKSCAGAVDLVTKEDESALIR